MLRLRDGSERRGAVQALADDGINLRLTLSDAAGVHELCVAHEDIESLHWTRPIAPPAPPPPVAADLSRESVRVLSSLDEVQEYLSATSSGKRLQLSEQSLLGNAAWQARFSAHGEDETGFDLCARLGLPYVDLAALQPTSDAIAAIKPDLARRCQAMPVLIDNGALALAVANPADADLSSAIEVASGKRAALLVANRNQVLAAIGANYDRIEDAAILRQLGLSGAGDEDSEAGLRETERMGRERPIVHLVAELIGVAAARRASDIHVRPGETSVEILLRIDGNLILLRHLDRALLRALVSRIKILGGMNIAERRLPQDGRATASEKGELIDLRISVIPTVFGESVVIRLLNTREGLRSLDQVGFSARDEGLFRGMLARDHGMILVTGPTGSGKSTTLYAALQEVRRESVNVITVEDPVEYHIPGVEQIQINRTIGYTFAKTLRNILRHDPDVIMVGEIRDRETAQIAVEAALTGHILLSTLHTNNAATTVTRLLDLGVESFLLRSTLLGLLSQRLARRNCRHCLQPESIAPHLLEAMGANASETFYRGAGCRDCDGLGVRGRLAVYELLPVTHAIRTLIEPHADADRIHALALAEGMQDITAHALSLARAGIISLGEAHRVRVE